MGGYKWSILVPTVPARTGERGFLLENLYDQVSRYDDIEVLVLEDNLSRQYGPKMQAMITLAQGEYLNFVDDDDVIPGDYVERIRAALDEGTDCVGFRAQVRTFNGAWEDVVFRHDIREWHTDIGNGEVKHYRSPQHLTPIRSDIVRTVSWADCGHYGADNVWSNKMAESGRINTGTFIDAIMYRYHRRDNHRGVW